MTGNWWTWIAIQLLAVVITGWLVGCSSIRQTDSLYAERIDKSDWIAVRSAREADVYCDNDNSCIDSDPTTEDLCLKSGECIHVHECQTSADCIGSIPGASVGCYEGLCVWYCGHCPEMDLHADNRVDPQDLAELLRRWGSAHPLDPADYDGNRFCNAEDLSVLLLGWDAH